MLRIFIFLFIPAMREQRKITRGRQLLSLFSGRSNKATHLNELKLKGGKMKNHVKNILLLATVIALMAALFPGYGQASELPKDILVYACTDSITTWDPSVSFSVELTYLANIYEPLIWVAPPGSDQEFRPGLAEKWEKSADGLTWTFHLRKGVKFHDGSMLNAKAVKDSFDRTKTMKKGASFILGPIKEIKALDEYTVQFDLNSVAPLDRIVASAYAAWIISPNAVGKDQKWFEAGNEAGSGPYMLEKSKPDEEIVLKKFDDYWGGWDKPHFERIVVKIVKEAAVQEQMIDSGVADLGNRIPVESMKAFDQQECCHRLVGPSFLNYALHLNTQKAPFNNQIIRQAVSYALPYSDMVEISLGGLGRQSVGPIPYSQFGHDKNLFQYSQNIEKAKDLMAEAGFPNGIKEKIVYTYAAENQVEKAFSPLVKEALAKIGLDVEIRPMIWNAQWDLMKGGPEKAQHMAALLWWPTFSDPYDTLYSLWHSEEKPFFNFAYYKNPAYDKLIDEAYTTPDAAAAEALYFQAQKILVEEAPSVYLFDVELPVFMRNELKGYVINPSYPRVAFFYDMYKE
jgi:peptide/nickel transport system substrate-binding protein